MAYHDHHINCALQYYSSGSIRTNHGLSSSSLHTITAPRVLDSAPVKRSKEVMMQLLDNAINSCHDNGSDGAMIPPLLQNDYVHDVVDVPLSSILSLTSLVHLTLPGLQQPTMVYAIFRSSLV